MINYLGKRVYEGIVLGKIINYTNEIVIENNKSLGYTEEMERFNNARLQAIKFYEQLYNSINEDLIKEEKQIILSFIAILDDLDLIENVDEEIKVNNLSAEKAVYKASLKLKQILQTIDNEYLQERAKDIEEATNKIISFLQQNHKKSIIPDSSIIVTNSMTVADMMLIDKEKIKGLVLENISPNAHIAILAKSLSIPCIASLQKQLNCIDNTNAILDATNGILIVNPDDEQIEIYQNKQKQNQEALQELEKYKYLNIKTIDQKTIKVYANITSSYEVENVVNNNADGIGLFRSEFIFLNANTFPSEEEQFEHYKKVLLKMNNLPTIIRTLDIGADKQVAYFHFEKESNPALGYRGVRIYKEFSDVFYTQIKALLRASIYGNLKIMIPMINNIDEVVYVKEVIENVKKEFDEQKIKYNKNIALGIMIETPSAAIISDELAKIVDFFSIGTNDLCQYTLAMDRENAKILPTFNPKHKAILRLIYDVSKNAKKNNIEIGICGEMAKDKSLLLFYIKCGIDELSVSSSYILQLKKNICEVNTTEVEIEDYIK